MVTKTYLSRNSGSLQHPYHFWLGYLLPLANEIRKNKISENARVRDCGPMNEWFYLISSGKCKIEIEQPGILLTEHLVKSKFPHNILNWRKTVIFDAWDDHLRFSRRDFRKTIDWLSGLQNKENNNESHLRTSILILNRTDPPTFYKSPDSEVKSSGSDRRCIPNIFEIDKALSAKFDKVTTVDLAHNSAEESLSYLQGCRTLVGQYGAGLTNMIWMKAGALVVEITASEPNLFPVDCYRNLARICGHSYVRVEAQVNWKSDADPEKVLNAVHIGGKTANYSRGLFRFSDNLRIQIYFSRMRFRRYFSSLVRVLKRTAGL